MLVTNLLQYIYYHVCVNCVHTTWIPRFFSVWSLKFDVNTYRRNTVYEFFIYMLTYNNVISSRLTALVPIMPVYVCLRNYMWNKFTSRTYSDLVQNDNHCEYHNIVQCTCTCIIISCDITAPLWLIVAADGSSEFQPESGRYHLYVQHLCPFAHRAVLGRSLKGLQNAITLDNLDWDLSNKEKGWKFSPEVLPYYHVFFHSLLHLQSDAIFKNFAGIFIWWFSPFHHYT